MIYRRFFQIIEVRMKDIKQSIREKKPWPTVDAMEQIYAENLWGGGDAEFYSGTGSHQLEMVQPYLERVISFLRSFENPISVCDLGCGDFNIGKDLYKQCEKYIGVDIVSDLIDRNKKLFHDDDLEFQCLDIAKDDLPAADCAIVRQVLQHLSNEEVQQVLNKWIAYKYVLLTEHLPKGAFEPNKDIISGQGTRLKKQSGLNILAAPFHFKVKEQEQLLTVASDDCDGVIVTTLYSL
jgi:hypothetical protein